jgi:hypothetical protein
MHENPRDRSFSSPSPTGLPGFEDEREHEQELPQKFFQLTHE